MSPLTIIYSVAAVLATVCFIAFITSVGGHGLLPTLLEDGHYTNAMIYTVTTVWLLSFLALILLWILRRPHTVLDLWLMVTMFAWICDIGLSAVFNQGRFDLGFYAGRIYGLLAVSFVLIILLLENGKLYGKLIESFENEHLERLRVQQKSLELMAVNKELDAFSYSVSHDLRAPLRAMDGYLNILEEEHLSQLGNEGKRLLSTIRKSMTRMGLLIEDLLAFSHLGHQPLKIKQIKMNEIVEQVIEELKPSYEDRKIQFIIGNLEDTEADPTLVTQIISNLLSNSIKFTRKKIQLSLK